MSSTVKTLVSKMLRTDPSARLSAKQAFNSPWIQQCAMDAVQDNSLSKQTLQSLSEFRSQGKMRQATLHYIASKMLTAQEIEELRVTFISLDVNGDGKISASELSAGFESFGLYDPQQMGAILRNCDADHNGFIEYTEFLAATFDWQMKLSQEQLEAAFLAYDVDASGCITIEELKRFIGDESLDDSVWEMIFKDADFNQDGVIDICEFKELMLAKNTH